ncbi:hypothetical protein JXA63_00785 [Candidatus Woesebacteria bacterium]|nr:hypothetical protein [Candidatus Woesebacteria bacterium]
MDATENTSDASEDFSVAKSEKAKSQPRFHGKFFKAASPSDKGKKADKPGLVVNFTENKASPTLTGDDAPLVDVKVTNPVTYLKKWWKKIIGNEGIMLKFSLKIKPLTAFLLVAFVVSGGITINLLNRLRDKSSVAQYIPAFGYAEPVERAFSGRLESDGKGNYFVITATEVIRVQSNLDLEPFMGENVLVSGSYSDAVKTLSVTRIKKLL